MDTPVIKDFDEWKGFLSKQVNSAKGAGTPMDSIVNVATRIGNFLSDKVDPKNREQRLMKELWDVGTDEERHALASMITKMVSDGKVH